MKPVPYYLLLMDEGRVAGEVKAQRKATQKVSGRIRIQTHIWLTHVLVLFITNIQLSRRK